MLAYTTYSEAGGIGKTTIAGTLAVAHARAGLDVLAIDLDPQNGSLSYLLDVADERDQDVDNLAYHLIGRPRGEFSDLIRESEGVDVVPTHNMLERLTELLIARFVREEPDDIGMDELVQKIVNTEWPLYDQLLHVLRDAGIRDDYDVLVIDPPATTGVHLYNAINATRSLVVPAELSGKGQQSIEGLTDVVEGMEEELGFDVGVLAILPNGVKNTRDQQDIQEEIEALGFPVPAVFGDRASLFEGCWRQQCSAFKYVEEHRSRKRDYEMDTLDAFEDLARFLEEQAGLETADEPEVTA